MLKFVIVRASASPVIRGCVLMVACVLRAGLVSAHQGIAEQEQDASRLVAQHPDDVAARLRLAKVHQIAGHWDDALAAVDDALEHGAAADECDATRGQILLDAGFPRAAIRALSRVLRHRPDAWGTLFDRARAHRRAGDVDAADADFTQAVANLRELRPEHVFAHRDALLAAGRPADAIRALDVGMTRLGPIASLQLAALDLETEAAHWPAALARLDQLLRQAPDNEAWVARRGDLLDRAGRHEDAHAAYERALHLITARPANRRGKALDDLEQRLRAALATTVARHGPPQKGD